MAAPSKGDPVTMTVGAKWCDQGQFSQRTSRRLSVAVRLVNAAITLVQVTFGVMFFHDCPQQPNIPIYLLVMALIRLLIISFVTLPWESQPKEFPKGATAKAYLLVLMCLFDLIWILAGDVWNLSMHQPNYDPTAADGLYCTKTLYTFAFPNASLFPYVYGCILLLYWVMYCLMYCVSCDEMCMHLEHRYFNNQV